MFDEKKNIFRCFKASLELANIDWRQEREFCRVGKAIENLFIVASSDESRRC